MKILWITNIPSPYRVDFFNEMGKNSNLTVLFERTTSKERNEKWISNEFTYFESFFLKGLKFNSDKAISFQIIKFLKRKRYDHIIISNPFTPTGIIAIQYMKIKKISYSIVSDGGFAKDGKGVIEKLKRFILRGAHLYFSTASLHDDYYLKYGASREKIVRYPFTSLKKQEILVKIPTTVEKNKIKKDLDIPEKKVILSVGQFIQRKGFDILIKASSQISQEIGIYIIGGNPPHEFLELQSKGNYNNIHFLDFKTKDVLLDYYKAADLFVLPTREDIWGLVINEAMANALPIITTNKCMAGLELVDNGCNGYIVPVNNEEILAEKINESFNDMQKLNKMGTNSLFKIKDYSIENMARVTIDILNKSK